MDAELWSRAVDLFHVASERPEDEQEALVDASCNGSAEIKRIVMDMLDEDRRGVSRLGREVAEIVDSVFAEPPDSPPFLPPAQIGPYERREFLGKGGMGAVWKYLRADTAQPMAIKFLFLRPEDPSSGQRRKRFAKEINTLARLRHPHIVSFHDAGALEDGTPWFAMDFVDEYVRGMRFTAYCRQPGHTIEEQLRLFRTVCEAVLYAHLQGTLHRDLKPSNILIAIDGSPRIVDFGIARQIQDSKDPENATIPAFRFMSPDYAAPEWKRDGQIGAATDVYSLGVILYEILTGHHPYRNPARPVSALVDDSARGLPEKPSAAAARQVANHRKARLPRSAWSDLDKLCLKAMHPDPRERYASVESLIRDIDHYLKDEPLDAQPGMLRYRVGKFLRRHRQGVLAAAVVLALMVTLLALFLWRLTRERNVALAQAARVQHLQDFMTELLQGGDKDAGPAADLPVTAMIDHGVLQAGMLNNEPQVQADLNLTLGSMSQELGRLDQAESLLLKSLHEEKSIAGGDPDAIAKAQIALALVRADEGRAKEAEQQVRELLGELRGSKTSNKILLGQAELALGSVMIQAGEQKLAFTVLDQAIKDITAAEGTQSPELARALGMSADANIYTGSYDKADELNRRALEIDRAVYGENHPHVADDLGNLAQTDEVRGYYAQAEPLEREALAITLRWYGPDHHETARKMTTLASTLLFLNKIGEANDLLHRALAIEQRIYGPNSPHVAYVVNAMGSAALYEKEFEDAENDDRRVADIYRNAYGDADYRVAVSLGNLASVYQAEKRYAEAASTLLEVVQRFTLALGAANIQTGMAQVRLGRNLLHEDKYAECEAHSLAGYNILVNQMNPDSAWIAGARHDLAVAYAALGDAEKAKQFGSTIAVPTPAHQ